MDALATTLRAGAAILGTSLVPAQIDNLLAYLALVQKWNRVYNLTSVRDPSAMLVQHILDSLAVVRPLRRHTKEACVRLLDVGSGAGLPGVVIAIACPEISVHCVDAVAKKVAFIRQVAGTLTLENLQGHHARVEDLSGTYEVVVSRAFASLADFVSLTTARLVDGGVWLAMKGKLPTQELAGLPVGTRMFHVEQLTVPGLQAERCLVWLERGPTLT